jgi:hypothetical protein
VLICVRRRSWFISFSLLRLLCFNFLQNRIPRMMEVVQVLNQEWVAAKLNYIPSQCTVMLRG